MRIAIPSDDGVNIAAHTGRAGGFIIFEVENYQAVKLEYRDNQYTAHAKGECNDEKSEERHQHRSHSELLGALNDCQIMIARGMGPRLVADLSRRGIEVVFCDHEVAEDAAVQFAAGELVSTGKSCCDH